MSTDTKTVVKSAFPVLGVLGIVLVVMKLMGVASLVNVSWWLILLPFYLGALIFVGFIVLLMIAGLIAALLS